MGSRSLIVLGLYLAGIAAVGLIVAATFLLPPQLRFDPAVRILETLLALAVLMFFTLAAWRRTDETAREAHKVAGLWGSLMGLVIGWIALGSWAIIVVPVQAARQAILALSLGELPQEPLMLMMLGAAIVILSAGAGYVIAWAMWWLRASPSANQSISHKP